jgi:hypothetical protein
MKRLGGYKTPFEGKQSGYFIWHAEHNACEECKAKDGKVFEYGKNEEPPLHPNCKCTIEDIELPSGKNKHNFFIDGCNALLKK